MAKKSIDQKIQEVKMEINENEREYEELMSWVRTLKSAKEQEMVDHIDDRLNSSKAQLHETQTRIELLRKELGSLRKEKQTMISPPPRHKYFGDVLYTREELDFEREERELEEETQEFYNQQNEKKALGLLALGIGGVCLLKQVLKNHRHGSSDNKHFYCC